MCTSDALDVTEMHLTFILGIIISSNSSNIIKHKLKAI